MKSVTSNAPRQPFVRPWVYVCGLRQAAVKPGVEDGYLRNGTKSFLDELDSVKLDGIMERRERRHARDGGLHFRSDQGRVFEFRPAVHDAMSDHIDRGGRRDGLRLLRPKIVEQLRDRAGALLDFDGVLEGRSPRVLRAYFSLIAIQLNPAFPQWHRWMFGQYTFDRVKAGFLAARTSVENEDLHTLERPLPVLDFRHIVPMLTNVLLVLDEFVSHELFKVSAYTL